VYLHCDERARPPGDERELSFRLFRFGWDEQAELLAISQAEDWVDAGHDLDLSAELASMHRALRRSVPVPEAAGRIGRVCTRSAVGVEAVRFASYEPCTLEVTIDAVADLTAPVVGVQVRDSFDRLLWTTRTDWQGQQVPALAAGQSATIAFATQKLLLGRGLYQVTVAVHQYPNDGHVFHWIDGVWRFEVIESGDASFKGVFDLGWTYAPEPEQKHPQVPALSRS
jgi:hypothetical protein